MIKLLHLADLHIGVENYGRMDAQTGIHSRLRDFLDRLDEAVALAIDEGVHLVVIAGDIYKNRLPNPTQQREFARRMLRLRDAGIGVFIITGNHDISPSVGRAHSVEIFQALELPGITVAHRPATYRLRTSAGEVQMIALPWVTRHGLFRNDELRDLSQIDIERMLRQRVDTFLEQSLAALDEHTPAVLVLHATLDGARVGAQSTLTPGNDFVLSRGVVADPRLDYVAMGHIHRHQSLGDKPPLVYAGSLERIDFGERTEDKGCVLVELERGNTRWQFRRLNARPFVLLSVDVRGQTDPRGCVQAVVAQHDLTHAVVRLEVTADREQAATLRDDDLRPLLDAAGAFLVMIAIDDASTHRPRMLDEEARSLHGITPRAALQRYWERKQVPPDRMARLLATADELLAADADDDGE